MGTDIMLSLRLIVCVCFLFTICSDAAPKPQWYPTPQLPQYGNYGPQLPQYGNGLLDPGFGKFGAGPRPGGGSWWNGRAPQYARLWGLGYNRTPDCPQPHPWCQPSPPHLPRNSEGGRWWGQGAGNSHARPGNNIRLASRIIQQDKNLIMADTTPFGRIFWQTSVN